MKVLFFGSTSDSVFILEKLRTHICAVVTQPARPVGRKQVVTPTPVATWGTAHGIPVHSFPSDSEKPWIYADEGQVVDTLQPLQADLLVSACYGQRIPIQAIQAVRFGGLNVHPSLLPRWRGADPVPWAILTGDHQTGVTVVTLSDTFDRGEIIAQKKVSIKNSDTSDTLRTKLFEIGATLLGEVIPDFISQKRITKNELTHNEFPYARRLTRDDGFEPWEVMRKAFDDAQEAIRIDRKFRAFTPWPGLWTKIGEKRLKILRVTYNASRITLDLVQLEGKKPVSWQQFVQAYSALLTVPHNSLH